MQFLVVVIIIVTINSVNSCFNQQKPNIILIVVDDLGWADLGCYGSTFYETPNIDKLAMDGIRFTDAYAAAANCAPSRACYISGQYTPRHGIYTVNSSERGDSRTRKLIPVKNKTFLANENVTIAEVLKSAGYNTISIGKWHLGKDPIEQGFDINIAGDQRGHPKSYFSPYYNKNLSDGADGEHLPDRLTDEAIKFIRDNKTQPFFLYLPYYSVHTPLQARSDLITKYSNKDMSGHQNNATYAGMIESVDANVGRLVQVLSDLSLEENTLVIFTSDNGGVAHISSQFPLRGGKGSYYEGGIRVPLITKWIGKIKPGQVCHTPVSGIDFFPTFLEIAGIPVPDNKVFDGISLMPLFKEPGIKKERNLYWHFPVYLENNRAQMGYRDPVFRTRPGSAMRSGDWKLHEYFEDNAIELYNLEEDPGEMNNLVDVFPEKAEVLRQVLHRWRDKVGAPIPTRLNPEYDSQYGFNLRIKRKITVN